MLGDHAEPGHLLFGELGRVAGVAFEDPLLEPLADESAGVGEAFVEPHDAAQERYECDELVLGCGAGALFELVEGRPDAGGGECGAIGLQAVEHLADHAVGQLAKAVGLVVVDAQGCDLVLVGFNVGPEVGDDFLGVCDRLGVPLGGEERVRVLGVDDLLEGLAGVLDEVADLGRERSGDLAGEAFLGGFELLGRRVGRLGHVVFVAGGILDDIGIVGAQEAGGELFEALAGDLGELGPLGLGEQGVQTGKPPGD